MYLVLVLEINDQVNYPIKYIIDDSRSKGHELVTIGEHS